MMKKIVKLALLSLLISSPLRADDLTRNAQAELKTQGFYYGEIDGALTSETTSSIKRFQIRNGLEVTGTLTEKTIDALGLSKAETARIAQVPQVAPPPASREEPQTRMQEDRPSPRRDETFLPPRREIPREMPPLEQQDGFTNVFARTPFAHAPLELQRSTVTKAQALLSREGFFRSRIDGVPTPVFEEALLTYQRRSGLRLTGRLDLETLNSMRLLPGRGGPPLQPFNERTPQKVYRGVWVR